MQTSDVLVISPNNFNLYLPKIFLNLSVGLLFKRGHLFPKEDCLFKKDDRLLDKE